MLKIGLTGGIGSGKTTVSIIFKKLGIPVYYADEAGKNLMDNDAILQQKIIDLFGPEVKLAQGLDKVKLAAIAFNDATKLQGLNALIHPAVALDFKNWCSQQKAPYVLKEAAILFETGSYQQLDGNILVLAPQELRIKRVMKRNNISRAEVVARIEKQWPDQKKIPLSDYVIYNDLKQSLIKQTLAIHENIIGKTNPTS